MSKALLGVVACVGGSRGNYYGRIKDDLIGAERGFCVHRHKTKREAMACAVRKIKTGKGAYAS